MLVFEGEVYAWQNELRDAGCERHDAYVVHKTGLVFSAEGVDDYNCAKEWVAINSDAE